GAATLLRLRRSIAILAAIPVRMAAHGRVERIGYRACRFADGGYCAAGDETGCRRRAAASRAVKLARAGPPGPLGSPDRPLDRALRAHALKSRQRLCG